MAGGGRLEKFSVAEPGERSLPSIFVEAAGVGGRLARGMIWSSALHQQCKRVDCHLPKIGRVNGMGERVGMAGNEGGRQ